MSAITTVPRTGVVRARLNVRVPGTASGSTRAATVRPAASAGRDEQATVSPIARVALGVAASLCVALPVTASAPVGLSVDEQIAAQVTMYDGMAASCKNEACRTTTKQWADASIKKIQKKNGIVTAKPKTSYPAPKKAPSPIVVAAAVAEPVVEAAAPKAEIATAGDAKADAKARLAERQAASARDAEQQAAAQAAKAASAKAAAEQAAAEKASAIKAKAAEAEAAKAAKEAAKAAPAPAAKPAPSPAKKAEQPKKQAPKKQTPESKGVTSFDAVLGDAVVLALFGAAGVALAKPSVKDKAFEGDVSGALEEAKTFVTGTEGVVGKAAAAGVVVAVDAAAHLPVLGFLTPGPLEYIGACAATLLLARYVVTKDATIDEDLAGFGKKLPQDIPAPDDLVSPTTAVFGKLSKFATEFDFESVKGDTIEWFNGLEDPVETIAPPAAALFVANLLVYAAHVPVINLAAPRALELAGVAVLIAAVETYGNTSAKFTEDVGRYAVRGGDAIKQLIEK